MAGCEGVVEFLQTWMKRGVPDTALHEAKRLLLNQLKASIAAAAEPSLHAAHDIAAAAWTPSRPVAGSAQVLWYGTRNTPAQVALVNAMAFDLLDLGATCIAAPRQAVAGVLAAVLAQAEAGAHDGRDALTALVLGIEVQLACDTASAAANVGQARTMAPAGLGAAAACAVLGGLSPERMREALELAAGMGPRATDTRRDAAESGYSAHLTGLAARAGVEACQLAERGLRVPPSSRLPWADGGLDEKPWRLFDHAFHTLPTSVPVHAVVDGVLALLPLAAGRTPRHLRLLVAPTAAARGGRRRMAAGDPDDAVVALQDMRLCAAAAWRRGRFSAAQMLAPGFFDAATGALAARIEVVADARRERLDGCSLEAEFSDGSTASATVAHYLGSPGRPLSDPQLSELFREVSEDRLPPEQAGRILQVVWALDAAPDIHGLMALLRGPGR